MAQGIVGVVVWCLLRWLGVGTLLSPLAGTPPHNHITPSLDEFQGGLREGGVIVEPGAPRIYNTLPPTASVTPCFGKRMSPQLQARRFLPQARAL